MLPTEMAEHEVKNFEGAGPPVWHGRAGAVAFIAPACIAVRFSQFVDQS
jgi:hypothetical protein